MLSSLSSLRVRLPLLFLAGIVLAGFVTGLIAIQLFRDFARNQTLKELQRESKSVAQAYSSWVKADFAARNGQSRRPVPFAGAALEAATGDKIYFDGQISPFPGEDPGLTRIDLKRIDWRSADTLTFTFTPPHLKGAWSTRCSRSRARPTRWPQEATTSSCRCARRARSAIWPSGSTR